MAAEFDIGSDVGGFEDAEIVYGVLDGERGISVEDAVTVSEVCSLDSGKLNGDDSVIEQREQPLDRANKALGLASAPVHVLRPVEGGEFFGQVLGENFSSGAAFAIDDCADVFPLGRRNSLEGGDFDSRFFGERVGGGRGL